MASPTESVVNKIKAEVAVAIGVLLAVVNALQVAAVPLPTWTHVVVLVVTTVAASLGIRARVTPTNGGAAS
jgi:hypothetical protein